jgi:hypothetical protein
VPVSTGPLSNMAAVTKNRNSSNDQNCSILSQNVPKFELYKYNDELFNIYYGIFYELWTLPIMQIRHK